MEIGDTQKRPLEEESLQSMKVKELKAECKKRSLSMSVCPSKSLINNLIGLLQGKERRVSESTESIHSGRSCKIQSTTESKCPAHGR